jgi:hypothetical protein
MNEAKPAAIRMVVTLERAANPRLYDALKPIPPGKKRVNRLRNLALEGLLAQQWASHPATVVETGGNLPGDRSAPERGITNAVFDVEPER